MTKVYLVFCLIFYTGTIAQSITIDDSSRDASQLVQLLLENSCTTASNISISSSKSTAYFNNNASAFPIKEGVIIRNGIAKYTEGKYTGNNLSSQLNNNSDFDLQKISNSAGQNIPISDVAYLEFDFVPLSNKFSFDFLFASNEYGNFQCGFSDVFAFLLTDLDSKITTNLAIIPGTEDPVSVKNIRDTKYNSSCASVNSNLFSTYTPTNPSLSNLNMRGFTQVLKASAVVIPNHAYRIRLVIGDANDSNYDSAVFLSSGSFTTNIDLGPDQNICDGNKVEIKTGLTDPKYKHSWKKNNQTIIGENQETLMVKEVGTYQVTIKQIGTNCVITDEITFRDLKINTPKDLRNCNSGAATYIYDLTQNSARNLGLDGSLYELFYFTEPTDAKENTNPIVDPQRFGSSAQQTIYIKIKNKTTNAFCNSTLPFQLLLDAPITPKKINDIELCDIVKGNKVDLTQNNLAILDGLDSNLYAFSYYSSEQDAANNSNSLSMNYSIPPNLKTITIWTRITNVLNRSCFTIMSFNIVVNTLPMVDVLPNVVECSNYILPVITHGNYYTGIDGTGTLLYAGDLVEKGGTYYIFSGPDSKTCTNQSSFVITLIEEYSIKLNYCGVFSVPQTSIGNFYTSNGGPTGTGKILPAGTNITTNQTVYYYALVNDSFCKDEGYAINIIPLPLADAPGNVITCNSYTLPNLTHGNYYTSANGGGTKLAPGTVISVSKTIYIFNTNGSCTKQNSFIITIIPSVIDQSECGSYTLPNLSFGNYYTEAAGRGTIIPFGTKIVNSKTIYIYANTTTTPNCTNDLFFKINIKPLPLVDQLSAVLRCENDPYILPKLTYGEYFTGPNRTGNKLNETDKITTSQTVYINNLLNGCTNESSFKIEMRQLPKLTIITDITSCQPYEIPKVADGIFYTEPQGKGTKIAPGTVISKTQTIYLYNQWPDLNGCSTENPITINIIGIIVDKPTDVNACDSYILPSLTTGKYYTLSGGKGIQLSPGTSISTTQKIYIYGTKGGRFICEDENAFTITISKTPVLSQPLNIAICGSYTLPILVEGNYFTGTRGSGTQYFAGDHIVENQTLYVFAAADNLNCFDEKKFNITIYPLNNLELEGGVLCVDYNTGKVLNPVYLNSKLDPLKFTVHWYLKNKLLASGPDFIATQEGIYDVLITKNIPDIGNDCGYNPATFKIEKSSPAIATIEVSDSFADIINITATSVLGYGDYEYKLDDGMYQDDPVFTNVTSGEHSITINDKKGTCKQTVLNTTVLKHPKFFTPNNDGFNDTWNIPDLASQPNALISIYDRYGKLLKSFTTATSGWDGRYHGADLPSDDYWFIVNYDLEGKDKIFKSHFSLIR
jgi:gliding motility-associated-like protein